MVGDCGRLRHDVGVDKFLNVMVEEFFGVVRVVSINWPCLVLCFPDSIDDCTGDFCSSSYGHLNCEFSFHVD